MQDVFPKQKMTGKNPSWTVFSGFSGVIALTSNFRLVQRPAEKTYKYSK
jgi:uncharacterized membrane protein YdcZ (DUF606 family)